jgi:hypothetical protein
MGHFSMKITPLPGSLPGGNQQGIAQGGYSRLFRPPWGAAIAVAALPDAGYLIDRTALAAWV